MMKRFGWALVAVVVLMAGAWLKSIAVPAGAAAAGPEAQTGRFAWPWGSKAVVTPYFVQQGTGFLIPVARSVKQDTPGAALAELMAGPAPDRGLEPAIPAGVRVTGVTVEGPRAVLQAEGGTLPHTALRAIALTLGVETVAVSGKEMEISPAGSRLYYMSQGQPYPMTHTGMHHTPKETLETLLTWPAPEGVSWLPEGVSLDAFEVKKGVAYVRLRFTPELQELVEAGVWNFSPYYMGVVYTLTEFPEIEKVRFEFAGLSQLALKQCRTPLAVPLKRPQPEPGRAQEGI